MRAVPHPAGHGLRAIAVVSCTVLLAGVSAGAAAAGPVTRGNSGPAVPGGQLWVSRYNGPASGGEPATDAAISVAVSPGGSAVFVTGISVGSGGSDYATVGYDTATGAQLWASRYSGPGNGESKARQVTVSPDGATVFVTGGSTGATSGEDYATVAYDAATGAQLWASRYNGSGNTSDEALSLAVSPDGATVFVTGASAGATSGPDYATVAYNAATGARRWVRRYNGPKNGRDVAFAVAAGPGGRSVFVTGFSTGATSGQDYATIAYNAATGARRWVRRYNGPANRLDIANAVTVSPGGRSVFVTGFSAGATSGTDYATVAYNAATGARRWVSRYNGPANRSDVAFAVAAGPGGRSVFVTGTSAGAASGWDYATIAYSAATGARRWVRRYNAANRLDIARAVAVSWDGATVFVTGASDGVTSGQDYATVAYDAATGARLWASRYNGPGNEGDHATSLAVGPAGDTVYVTGDSSGGAGTGPDYATVAYRG